MPELIDTKNNAKTAPEQVEKPAERVTEATAGLILAQEAVAACEAALEQARKPSKKRIKALKDHIIQVQEDMDKATAPEQSALEEALKEEAKARSVKRGVDMHAAQKRFKTTPPKDSTEIVDLVRLALTNPTFDPRILTYGLERRSMDDVIPMRRKPRIPGIQVLAAKVDHYNAAGKLTHVSWKGYYAYRENELIAVLSVNCPDHVGDPSSARYWIGDSTTVVVLEGQSVKPVRTFKNALRKLPGVKRT